MEINDKNIARDKIPIHVAMHSDAFIVKERKIGLFARIWNIFCECMCDSCGED